MSVIEKLTRSAGVATARDSTDMLAQFLSERDIPCPSCKYNLRALTMPRCPECGERLELQVALQEPRLAGFVAGLTGLAAGAGFSGLLSLYFVGVSLWRRLPNRFWEEFMLVTGCGMIVEGACLWAWIHHGKQIRRCDKKVRRWLIAGCWLLTVVNLIVFSSTIR